MTRVMPKKSLGQHWLKSQTVIDATVAAGNLDSNSVVLEIGPGTGALTKSLLSTNIKYLIAVEPDQRARESLAQSLNDQRLRIIPGDILTLDLCNTGLQDKQYTIVANIPYYITGKILRHTLTAACAPKRLVLIMQREVAERIVANDKKHSKLSLSVWIFGTPKKNLVIKPQAFYPKPKVDSAILSIDCTNPPAWPVNFTLDTYFTFIGAAFAHKRKTLLKNLTTSSLYTQEKLAVIQHYLHTNNLSPSIRAEDLSLAHCMKLACL